MQNYSANDCKQISSAFRQNLRINNSICFSICAHQIGISLHRTSLIPQIFVPHRPTWQVHNFMQDIYFASIFLPKKYYLTGDNSWLVLFYRDINPVYVVYGQSITSRGKVVYMRANNYYNTKMKVKNAPLAPTSIQNTSNSSEKDIKRRQELIVQINIGKQGQAKEIHLLDINNTNYIDQQIKLFIKERKLKETAFSYIKEIIMKQISRRRTEIYEECHSKCLKNCKCQGKMHSFNLKEKKILGVISLTNNVRSSFSQSNERKTNISLSPQHISIKITPNPNNIRSSSKQAAPSGPANQSSPLSFTLGKDPIGNTKNIQSSNVQAQLSSCNSLRQYFSIKNPEVSATSLSSFTQNRHIAQQSISLRKSNNIENSRAHFDGANSRKHKLISTKERKEALMTPQRRKSSQLSALPDIILKYSQTSVGSYPFSQQNSKIIQKILESPLFPDKCVPPQFEAVTSSLFRKLTQQNPSGMTQLNSQFVSYQLLQREQLQLMGILFEKINYKDLNQLNYSNFRSNILKYCWKELEQLLRVQASPSP